MRVLYRMEEGVERSPRCLEECRHPRSRKAGALFEQVFGNVRMGKKMALNAVKVTSVKTKASQVWGKPAPPQR